MKRLTYDARHKRLNVVSSKGENVYWRSDGTIPDAFMLIDNLMKIIEGDSMDITYTKSPEGHMADAVISILQSMRGVLLGLHRVRLLAAGNAEVAQLIKDTLPDDKVGDSVLTKEDYVKIEALINSLTDWATTDITLPDATTITPKEVIMKAYEVVQDGT